MTKFQGTFKGETTSGDDLAKWICIGFVAVAVLGGGGMASAAAGIAAALTDLLYWIAGTVGAAVVAVPVVWAVTRGRRMDRRIAAAEHREALERAYHAEVLERRQARAAIQAEAQARAWAPLITAIAAAVTQQQPQPAPVIRGEVER